MMPDPCYTLRGTRWLILDWGELLGLEWSDIEFKNKTISVSKTLVTINGKLSTQSPKTKRSARTISLDDNTVQILKDWKLEQKKLFFKYGVRSQYIVITNTKGGYFDFAHFRDELRYFLGKHKLKQYRTDWVTQISKRRSLCTRT